MSAPPGPPPPDGEGFKPPPPPPPRTRSTTRVADDDESFQEVQVPAEEVVVLENPTPASASPASPGAVVDLELESQQPQSPLQLQPDKGQSPNPWPRIAPIFAFLRAERSKQGKHGVGLPTLVYKCVLCEKSEPPVLKEVRTNRSSLGNLRRHMLVHSAKRDVWKPLLNNPRNNPVIAITDDIDSGGGGGGGGDDNDESSHVAAASGGKSKGGSGGAPRGGGSSVSSGTSTSTSSRLTSPVPKQQQTIVSYFKGKTKSRSQADVNAAVVNLVVAEMLPFHIVDRPAFQHFVKFLQPERQAMCRKTLMQQLKNLYSLKKEALSSKLKENVIATTTDLWSAHNRGYLGATVHWIDKKTVERHSAVLACRRMKGRHNFSSILTCIQTIHEDFNIEGRVSAITTDNASNFAKAFRHHVHVNAGEDDFAYDDDDGSAYDEIVLAAMMEDCYGAEQENIDGPEVIDAFSTIVLSEDDVIGSVSALSEESEGDVDYVHHPVPIADIIDQGFGALRRNTPAVDDSLVPDHQRCAAHTLNLVATTDMEKAIRNYSHPSGSVSRSPKVLYRSAMAKLTAFWNKYRMSTVAADRIRLKLGRCPKIPNKTRWNSTFDAVKDIMGFVDGKKFNDCLKDKDLGLKCKPLEPAEERLLREYIEVSL